MKKLFAMILSGLGILAASSASIGCPLILLDEPKMSKHMIER